MRAGWVVYTSDGLWTSDEGVVFKAKRDAVYVAACACDDPREVPKVLTIADGIYEYKPKDVDNPTRFSSDVFIIKHTDVLTEEELEEVENAVNMIKLLQTMEEEDGQEQEQGRNYFEEDE